MALPAVSVATAVSTGLSVLPASAITGSDTEVSRGITIPAFCNPPAELPAANGALVRTEPLPLRLSLPGLDGRAIPGTATADVPKSGGAPASGTSGA